MSATATSDVGLCSLAIRPPLLAAFRLEELSKPNRVVLVAVVRGGKGPKILN